MYVNLIMFFLPRYFYFVSHADLLQGWRLYTCNNIIVCRFCCCFCCNFRFHPPFLMMAVPPFHHGIHRSWYWTISDSFNCLLVADFRTLVSDNFRFPKHELVIPLYLERPVKEFIWQHIHHNVDINVEHKKY